MSALGRYIVDAIVLEHRRPTRLARDHDISRSWIYQLLERFKAGGYEALEPRTKGMARMGAMISPRRTSTETPFSDGVSAPG